MELSPLHAAVSSRAHDQITELELPLATFVADSIAEGNRALFQQRFAEAFERSFVALLQHPLQIELHINLGALCRRAGWLDYAELFYQRALTVGNGPLVAAAHANLGNLSYTRGELELARRHFELSLRIVPALVTAHRGLCEVGLTFGNDQLVEDHIQSLERDPAFPFAVLADLRGRLAQLKGDQRAAREWFRTALRHEPFSPTRWHQFVQTRESEPWRTLVEEIRAFQGSYSARVSEIAQAAVHGVLHAQLWDELPRILARLSEITCNAPSLYESAARGLFRGGQLQLVNSVCNEALRVCAPTANLLQIAAIANATLGRITEARTLFADAVRRSPEDSGLLSNISYFLSQHGPSDSAILFARRAILASHSCIRTHLALANALRSTYRLQEAIETCWNRLSSGGLDLEERAALFHEAAHSLINAGRLEEASQALSNAVQFTQNTAAVSCLAFANLYRDDITPFELARLHHDAGQVYLRNYTKNKITSWQNSSIPNRKLRVGLLSPDFRHHPVGMLLASWLQYINQEEFEIFCYSTHTVVDAITQQLRAAASAWRECPGMTQEAIAHRISADRVDLLVDLSGHTDGTNLGVFAIKPAPVQLSWAGYVFSTGLQTIDYVVHDQFSALVETETLYTEEVVRLNCMNYCYVPPHSLSPVGPTPALRRGYITFGCFNHVPKLTDSTLRLWARVLSAVPTSRLLLKAGPFADSTVAADIQQRLNELGVTSDRIRIEGPSPFEEYLAAYDDVDIALDPFPFNGGVTSLQGLWQGVPLLTRTGTLHVSRIGGSIMHALNMSSWVAETDDQFVAAAQEKSLNFERLDETRQRIRDRLSTSTVGNGKLFAPQMEQLWRDCWHAYCRRAV